MHRQLFALAAAVGLAACSNSAAGGYGGDPVKPIVEPPPLEQVHIEPVTPDRSEVVRLTLKPPQALPATQIDDFKQKPGIVDILWLMDDTGSMTDERNILADSYTQFITTLSASNTDYHIATISTDADDGAQLHGSVPIIDENTPDAGADFHDQITYPASRKAWVQGLAMMKQFLSTPNLNSQFLRPNAALAVIAVSNGDDDSLGDEGTTGNPGYYARFLRGVKGQGNENLVSFSTISGDLPEGCQPPEDATYYGSNAEPSPHFITMARDLDGVVGSICDTDFDQTLISIAEALNTLRKTFPLSLKPDPSTITVTVNGTSIPNDFTTGWTYSASLNAIQFLGSYVPPPNADVLIQYAIAGP